MKRRRSVWTRRGCAAISVTALALASGCGTRWSDEEQALQRARLEAEANRTITPGASVGQSTGVTSLSPDQSAAGGAAVPTGDDATSTGGGAAGGVVASSGPRPCSAPVNVVGVTDTEITIGTINSLSGPLPGLGASSLAATQAYVEYRNSLGGVCGRKVVLRSADDGGDNGTNRAAMSDLNTKVLGVVGGVAGAGDGGVDVVKANRIPMVGTAVAEQLDTAPTFFNVRPPLTNVRVATPKYRYLYEHGVRKAAIVYVAASAAPRQAEQIERPQIEATGIQVVLDQAVPLSTLSYDSTARAVANSGADFLLFIHAAEPSAAMAQSLADTGYKLKFAEYIVAYASSFVELAGDAAEGATSWLNTLPNEDGGVVAEQATFLKWMAQTAPEAALDTFAMQAWSGAKALLDTLEALPGAISREALVKQLAATGTYDAGGLLGPIELGAKRSRGCLVGVVVQDGKWRRITPAKGFLC